MLGNGEYEWLWGFLDKLVGKYVFFIFFMLVGKVIGSLMSLWYIVLLNLDELKTCFLFVIRLGFN